MIKVRTKKVFLFGYYGRNNIGDDIMLNNIVELLNRRGVKKIIVLSGSNDNNILNICTEKVNVIKGIKRNLFRVLFELVSCKIFLWGGGTCFFDNPNKRGFIELYIFFIIRKIFNKSENYFIGIGMEPMAQSLPIVKKIIKFTKGIVFRDLESKETYLNYFPNAYNKILGQFDDLVFHNSTFDIINKSATDFDFIIGEDYFTFSGHMKYGENMAIHCANELVRIGLKDNLTIVLLPAKFGITDSDELFHKLVEQEIKKINSNINVVNLGINSIYEFIGVLRKSRFHYGMRLHSLILADILGIPNVAIAYQNKIKQYKSNACLPTDSWSDKPIVISREIINHRIKLNTIEYDKIL